VYFARDLVSEAPNILYPESYAEQIIEKLEPLGIDVQVLGEREMRNLGMGALLGVGQGSAKESKLVVMKYQGGNSDQKPVCFVGKGVTFDTGGISIKPAAGMGDMKYDMGGSAAVVGAMKALALRNAKVNAVGIVGLAENMPGSNAQRPGDIVTSMSGQTIEVLNTDAEGRLVLCDCITYLQENFDPDCIIDLATLTGAILIALANTYAGCFSNDDELANKLINSGSNVNEKLWRMPLHKDFDEMLKSPIADISNIGGERGMAGSSTAAHFIGRFIKDGVKWAHLDIAGTAWEKKGKNPICPIGAVGFGVRLLDQFVQDNYESK
jgi:leucyl aminopeptidase